MKTKEVFEEENFRERILREKFHGKYYSYVCRLAGWFKRFALVNHGAVQLGLTIVRASKVYKGSCMVVVTNFKSPEPWNESEIREI
jgi:hypothetical protein